MIRDFVKANVLRASAPCRIDMGGTLDIRTFYIPLQGVDPCTINLALDLRTEIALEPYDAGMVKVSSVGFDTAVFAAGSAPYTHPLGLIFAVADAFSADGVWIDIRSASPPRSALGGSSVAAVALVAALSKASEADSTPAAGRHEAAMLAHAIEEAVASVPCGVQDQLAAAFGGANAWHWKPQSDGTGYSRRELNGIRNPDAFRRHVLVAYCGVPHESSDVNGKWVRSFLNGRHRQEWRDIARTALDFVDALDRMDWNAAVDAMNREVDIRKAMTPDVLDEMGDALTAAAREIGCGARFTGAGAGGCLWALGAESAVAELRGIWERLLSQRSDARLLAAGLDTEGLRVDCRRRE